MLKLTQEEIDDLTRPISVKKIETIITFRGPDERLISLMNINAKFLNKILLNQILKVYKELYNTTKRDLLQVCKAGSTFKNQLMSSIMSRN